MAVALTGTFPSHWRGKPVQGDSTGTAPQGIDSSPETEIVVVGSANFLDGRFLQQFPGNALFLANAVDWMSLGSDLIAIRSRGQTSRPMREIEDDKKGMLKTLAVIPVPVLLILFGLVRSQMRKTRRNRYVQEFGGRT